MNKRNSEYRCDVEHSSQLVENILNVFGFDVQDGKLSSNRQAAISEDRQYLHSVSHISYTRETRGTCSDKAQMITFVHSPSICSSNCEMKFRIESSREVII